MKRIISLLILIAGTQLSATAQNRHVIFFTDKNNSPYSVSNPQAFLSQRAIDRRTNQNITITQQDLPVNPSYVTGLVNAGATVLNTSRWFNSATIEVPNQTVLNNILGLPYVSNSSNVGRTAGTPSLPSKFREDQLRSSGTVTPAPSRVSAFNYGNSFNQVAMLKGDVMHQNGYTGAGMLIAVLDAGFPGVDVMPAFDSLRNSNRIVATWDFVDGNANVYDDHYHGTMVLSVMAGNVPGEIIGTAPHASYLLLRPEHAPNEFLIEEYNWASAAEFADSAGADIINSSLGYTRFDDPAHDHEYADLDGNTTPISRAAKMAAARGMVVCNSAGNEGNNSWFRISAPADADSILAVGAVDASSLYVGFSGKGPSVDGRVKPDVAAQGFQTFASDPWSGNGVIPANGTSFSSPLIAGMVATLWQCNPTATNMQIINAIRQSSHQANNPDSLLGYGIPDFPEACLILAGLNPGSDSNGDVLLVNGNPFGDDLSFTFFSRQPNKLQIRVTDILGKTVILENENTLGLVQNRVTLNTRGLSKGVYVLNVTSGSDQFSRKVIKK